MLAFQQLEAFVLVPVVQGRVISVSPLVALLAVLAGSALGGIVGALVSLPLVAVATVAIEDVPLPWRRQQFEASWTPASRLLLVPGCRGRVRSRYAGAMPAALVLASRVRRQLLP